LGDKIPKMVYEKVIQIHRKFGAMVEKLLRARSKAQQVESDLAALKEGKLPKSVPSMHFKKTTPSLQSHVVESEKNILTLKAGTTLQDCKIQLHLFQHMVSKQIDMWAVNNDVVYFEDRSDYEVFITDCVAQGSVHTSAVRGLNLKNMPVELFEQDTRITKVKASELYMKTVEALASGQIQKEGDKAAHEKNG
jgi:hypothetical protein